MRIFSLLLGVLSFLLYCFVFAPVLAASETKIKIHYIQPQTDGAVSRACSTISCKVLLEQITTARRSIDFAIYGMRGQNEILDALVAAKQRGIRVRGIVDKTLNGVNYYDDTEELIRRVGSVKDDQAADNRIYKSRKPFNWKPTCARPRGFKGPLQCLGYELNRDSCLLTAHASRETYGYNAIMHHKFFVVDDEWVWTGSANLSDTGTGGYNANAVVEMQSPEIARVYSAEFNQMFEKDKFHILKKHLDQKIEVPLIGSGSLEVLFSPQQKPMRRVIKLLSEAHQSIDVAIFFLTHKEVTRQLIKAHRRGVNVRIILDATAAKNGYTKHEILREAGVPVKVENWGGKMHMKAAAIDTFTLILGSMNWTSAGARDNDENTVIVQSERYAGPFVSNFNNLWTSIPDRWLRGNPDPESKMSIGSCIDNIDNDFDKNVDGVDQGCSLNPPALPKLPPFRIVPKKEGYGLIKGNISSSGKKIYHVPGGKYYAKTEISTWRGEKWFCSPADAKEAGWRRSRR